MIEHNSQHYPSIKKTLNLSLKLIYFCCVIIFMSSFKSFAIVFTGLSVDDCLIELEKSSSFLQQLQYKLAIISQNNPTAWLKHSNGKWFKLMAKDEISIPYPIKVLQLSDHLITFKIIVTPFCEQHYTIERQRE